MKEKEFENLDKLISWCASVTKHAIKNTRISALKWHLVLLFSFIFNIKVISDIFVLAFCEFFDIISPYTIWYYFDYLERTAITFLSIIFLNYLYVGIRGHNHSTFMSNPLSRANVVNDRNEEPKFVSQKEVAKDVYELTFCLDGHSIHTIEGKKKELETIYGKKILFIKEHDQPKYCSLIMTAKVLPELIRYKDFDKHLRDPFDIIIGETITGVLVEDFRKFPHLLIAGSTGSGKSYFLMQIIVPFVEKGLTDFVFIDLKGGVDLAPFEGIRNSKFTYKIEEATSFLESAVAEMNKRLEWMKKNKINVIDPIKHKKKLLLVVVDEASMLFTPVDYRHKDYHIIKRGRYAFESISKLGRAVGVHLIAAVQRIDRNSIPTQAQENFNARAAFKTSSIDNSYKTVKTTSAAFLPVIQGRGVWLYKSGEQKFQTPYITKEELFEIMEKYKDKDAYKNNSTPEPEGSAPFIGEPND